MKITHLSVMRELRKGFEAQLITEDASSKDIPGVEWNVLVIQDDYPNHHFSIQTPYIFRRMFLRNIYGWYTAIKISRNVDYIMLRHMSFDPFSLIFSPFIYNRISVHHAKEVDELKLISPGWKGKAASLLEKLTGRVAVRRAVAIAAVTKEIAEFECNSHGIDKATLVYPNGIDPEKVVPLPDERHIGTVRMIFMSSRFSAWHGLDRLIEAVRLYLETDNARNIMIHIVGNLSENQKKDIYNINSIQRIFKIEGILDKREYRTIMARCNLGIASLAMDRNNLKHGSTLKVREMLSSGLPVYSTHLDASLDENFTFYRNDTETSIPRMIEFSDAMQRFSREEVSKASTDILSKRKQMENFISDLKEGIQNGAIS